MDKQDRMFAVLIGAVYFILAAVLLLCTTPHFLTPLILGASAIFLVGWNVFLGRLIRPPITTDNENTGRRQDA